MIINTNMIGIIIITVHKYRVPLIIVRIDIITRVELETRRIRDDQSLC